MTSSNISSLTLATILIAIILLFDSKSSKTVVVAVSNSDTIIKENYYNNEMVEKKIVPNIETLADFNDKLSGFLNSSQKLALLLDYDGTLVPLTDRPENTIMSKETEDTLHWLTKHPSIFVAVISGRSLDSVKDKIGIKNITYAGNHGIEIENSDGTRSDYELPKDIRENYAKLVDDLNKVTKHGAWVEDKRVSLTYHYLQVPEELQNDLILEASKIIESRGFRASPAHFAVEAKPPVNWNKGEAAKFILKNKFGEDKWKSDEVRIVFAGDDTTDEDIMKAIHGIGKSFRVSTDPKIETHADYRLKSPNEVGILLKWLRNIYST